MYIGSLGLLICQIRVITAPAKSYCEDGATSLSLSCIGEGNGNPLQYSCLENPRDWGAGWAAVYGVAENQT